MVKFQVLVKRFMNPSISSMVDLSPDLNNVTCVTNTAKRISLAVISKG